MADNAKKNDSEKKPGGLMKKFALAAGAVTLAGALTVGGAAAINGVDRVDARSADGQATLHTMTISPVFERQTYNTPTSHYWCWSVASIECPIPIPANEKATYDALKNQPPKP